MQLNINTDAVVKHTATLEKLHKSALPVAIRQTLDSAAFDVKTNTMPVQAKKTFEDRDKNFFKANSKVKKAQGWNIESMESTVGFVPISGTNQAVDDLEEQEYGGKIDGRTFIPLEQARTSNSWKRKPRRKARMSEVLGNIIDSADAQGKSKGEKFIKSAIHAGVGGWVLGNNINGAGNRILYQVKKIGKKNGDTWVKVVPMFSVKSDRKVQPPATKFMQKSAVKSADKMEDFYKKHAEKQIAKYKNR